MDDDIAGAIAEFQEKGGEIHQLPDQIHPQYGVRREQTRFNFLCSYLFID